MRRAIKQSEISGARRRRNRNDRFLMWRERLTGKCLRSKHSPDGMQTVYWRREVRLNRGEGGRKVGFCCAKRQARERKGGKGRGEGERGRREEEEKEEKKEEGEEEREGRRKWRRRKKRRRKREKKRKKMLVVISWALSHEAFHGRTFCLPDIPVRTVSPPKWRTFEVMSLYKGLNLW